MERSEIPVYMMTGFLDAGKTSFARDVLTSPDFTKGVRTLFLRCEDGEEEFDEAELGDFTVTMVPIEKPEEFNRKALRELEKQYRPDQVVIEYNGMWPLSLLDTAFPSHWLLYQIICLVDAGTFDSYAKNMGSLMMEKLQNADAIYFNRCTPELKDYLRSRNLKMVNRMADIFLEDEDGEEEDYYPGGSPFDLDVPVLELKGDDYGVWYVDAMDNPDRYDGKTIRYKGMVVQSRDFPKGCCAVGRFAMVCCNNDMQFLGMVCKGSGAGKYPTSQWVELTAVCRKEYQEAFQKDAPCLYIESIVACDPPENEVVGF